MTTMFLPPQKFARTCYRAQETIKYDAGASFEYRYVCAKFHEKTKGSEGKTNGRTHSLLLLFESDGWLNSERINNNTISIAAYSRSLCRLEQSQQPSHVNYLCHHTDVTRS
jgi:hypothetical protein